MTALTVTEAVWVHAATDLGWLVPLVKGERLEGVERKPVTWLARRLSRGEPVGVVLVVPKVYVREEVVEAF